MEPFRQLSVYPEPNYQHDPIGEIKKNQQVEVVGMIKMSGETVPHDWGIISMENGIVGYVRYKALDTITD